MRCPSLRITVRLAIHFGILASILILSGTHNIESTRITGISSFGNSYFSRTVVNLTAMSTFQASSAFRCRFSGKCLEEGGSRYRFISVGSVYRWFYCSTCCFSVKQFPYVQISYKIFLRKQFLNMNGLQELFNFEQIIPSHSTIHDLIIILHFSDNFSIRPHLDILLLLLSILVIFYQ